MRIEPKHSVGTDRFADLALDTVLPMTPAQYAAKLIGQSWGTAVLDAVLVDLNYDFYGYPAQCEIHQGRARTSRSLVQALLENYQTVGAGRFGETAFGLYTPPTVGPQVRIVEIDESINPGGGYRDYEGIYRTTLPQVYGPSTQLALQPAAFKDWVWNLEFKTQYAAYVANAWPQDQALLAADAYPLRTAVKLAFVMAACLQHQERSLSDAGLDLALRAVALDGRQTWAQLTLAQLQASTVVPDCVEAARLVIYRYTSEDIWRFRDRATGRMVLYVPGNASPFHEFADHQALCAWVVEMARDDARKKALARHFAEDDREDGTFHAGVLTALAGMVRYPRQYRLKKGHGFFNNSGYWPPETYISAEVAPRTADPFAQWVRVMKRAAQASIDTIRDDAQVNRDNLSAVVEPVVQWVNRFGPLALFVPGGEGLLALAGLIDAGYGLGEAMNGKTTDERWGGVGRTLFGLLNALPVIKAGAVLKGEARAAEASVPGVVGKSAQTAEHAVSDTVATLQSRIAQLRTLVPETAAFGDDALRAIDQVCELDSNALALLQAGQPPSPILADTLNRFRIDQALQQAIDRLPVGSAEAGQALAARAEQFNLRYAATQQSEHEWVRLFQSQYPGLPKQAIEQMLDRSGIDIAASHTLAEAKRVLGELSVKAQQYERHVRLTRAYEGLYLEAVPNADSAVLALHSLERLAGWPVGARIEVREASALGRVLDCIGPRIATSTRQLIKSGSGYQDAARTVDFYPALLKALSPEQRTALGLRVDHGLEDLQAKLRAMPRSRMDLESGLRRMDAGLPFDSLGLRGGGFPSTTDAAAFSRAIEKLQLQELYPARTEQEIEAQLALWGENAQIHLIELSSQMQQLRVDLTSWVEQVEEDIDHMDIDLLEANDPETAGLSAEQIEAENDARIADAIRYERQTRMELASELDLLWQQRGDASRRVYNNGEFVGFRLEMDFEHFHSLPALNVQLGQVVELTMSNFSLTETDSLSPFLRGFRKLRVLDLAGTDLRQSAANGTWVGRLPAAIGELTELTHLNLRQTGLTLTEQAAGELSSLTRLTSLDMSTNPLDLPPLVLFLPALRRLNLRATGIRNCPVGVLDYPYLQLLDLRYNHIDRIPDAVRMQSVGNNRLLLTGNPLNDADSLRWVVRHRQETGINVWMGLPSADFAQPEAWLTGLSPEQAATQAGHWQHLTTLEGNERFFGTLDMVRRSADFRVNYAALQQRVWHLVDAIEASPALCQHVFRDVEWTAANGDDPLASFEQLEARVATFNAGAAD
ncbi:dermonecrotic toxin domain-containing protein [Pseudomonas frederiksbergensis]|uniref:dermonecrotic toxin domain-containing protein n=1 Tax=Pseudomonas frederiksbergensis TaxID=104087 RepID=UPI003D03289E